MRGKDAADIGYVLGNYEEIPSVADEAYDEANTGVMERYDWDLTLASAHLLGRHARQIATAQTSDAICALLQDKIKKRPIETLVSEMSQNPMEYERNDQMIKAFAAGFQEE